MKPNIALVVLLTLLPFAYASLLDPVDDLNCVAGCGATSAACHAAHATLSFLSFGMASLFGAPACHAAFQLCVQGCAVKAVLP